MISEDRLLSTAEVGELLGVDEQTVRLWIKNGKLEAFKVGRGWRIPQAAFNALIENAPKAETLRESRSEPTAGDSSFEERRILEERRLLSALHPFATRVEDETEYWRGLAENGKVSLDTLEYATKEFGFTARSFETLVDAAIAEHWSAAELRLLARVEESVAGPYRQAWNTLGEAGAKSAADARGVRRLRLVGDETMRGVEKAGETLRMAA